MYEGITLTENNLCIPCPLYFLSFWRNALTSCITSYQLWNSLPSDIHRIQSSHAFKTALKTHLKNTTTSDFRFCFLTCPHPPLTLPHPLLHFFCTLKKKKKKKSAPQSDVKLNLSYVWRHHFNCKQSVYSLPSLLSQFLMQCTDLLHYVCINCGINSNLTSITFDPPMP